MTVSQEIGRVRARLHHLPADIAKQGGEVMRTSLLDAARSDTGGDLRLSHVWWQNFSLDVSVTVSGAEDNSTALLSPEPLRGGGAIWSWLEHGTRPHMVGVSRKGRRKKIRIRGNWVTGPIGPVHMRAKQTWSRGVEAGTPKVFELSERLFGGAVDG